MKNKLHIKKGDTVKVLAGDSKGQQGKVLEVMIKTKKAIVEGINIVSKHNKPKAKTPQGGIVKTESPIDISNLMFVDSTGKPTKIGRRVDKNNKLVRYSKNTGEVIK